MKIRFRILGKITFTIIFCLISKLIIGQHILTIDEFSINKFEVPFGKFVLLNPSEQGDHSSSRESFIFRITSSADQRYYLISKEAKFPDRYPRADNQMTPQNTIITLYAATGEKLFSKDVGKYSIVRASIADSAKLIHLNLEVCNEDDICKSKLLTCNSEGEVLKMHKTSARPLGAYSKDKIVYYIYNSDSIDYNNRQEAERILAFNNFTNNETWEIKYQAKRLKLYDINVTGDILLFRKNNEMLAVDNYGKLIWSKEFASRPGIFSLSDNGNYLMNIATFGDLKVYNILTNDITLDKSILEATNGNYRIFLGGFVDGSTDILFFIDWSANQKDTRIGFYNVRGENVGNTVIKNKTFNSADKIDIIKNDNQIKVYQDGLLVIIKIVEW